MNLITALESCTKRLIFKDDTRIKELNSRLMKEYELLISTINRIGTTNMSIKGFCITITLGFISLIKLPIDYPSLSLICILIITAWILEASYRKTMEILKGRLQLIERYFDENDKDIQEICSPQMQTTHLDKNDSLSLTITSFFYYRVSLFYLSLIFGLIIYVHIAISETKKDSYLCCSESRVELVNQDTEKTKVKLDMREHLDSIK